MAHSSPPWDVNKYKSEFEPEEHWELRKKFMLTHLDKFTEDRLVCLSKVFFNVEFLGCRYPEKTMKLVEELSKGVADEFRESRKGKLKRTFVKASDAASDNIKRQGVQTPIEPPEKFPREGIGFRPANVDLPKSLPQPVWIGEFPGLILFEKCNKYGYVQTCPTTILFNSIQKNKIWNTITFSKERNCEIKINNKLLTSAEGATVKEAKLNAAIKGLDILRQTCYTIKAKQNFVSDGPSITKDKKMEFDTFLPQDNIGLRIMQKMGWSGSGLGKAQQGIQAPIQAAPQIMRRSGFGSVNARELEAKFRKCFRDYIKSDSTNDLVFSPDFTVEERKVLHRLAQSCKLKTQSYGKDDERHIVVCKHLELPQLLQELLACGGENDKYALIPPTDLNPDRISPMPSEDVVKQELSEVTTVPIEGVVKQELSEVTTMPIESEVDQELSKVTTTPTESGVNQELSVVTTTPIENKVKQELYDVTTLPTESGVKQELPKVMTIPFEWFFEQDMSDTTPSDNVRNEQATSEINSMAGETYNIFVNSSANADRHFTYERETVENPGYLPNTQSVFTPNCDVTFIDDADMALVDEVLQKKDSDLRTILQVLRDLMDKFRKEGNLGKKAKRKYVMCRNTLLKYTGKCIPNLLIPNPEQQVKSQSYGHRMRCIALGTALVRNSLKIKNLLCTYIKNRWPTLRGGQFPKEENRKKATKSIVKGIKHFGDLVLRDLLNNDKEYKKLVILNPIFDSLVATNFISVKNDPFVINEKIASFTDSDVVTISSTMPYLEALIAAKCKNHVTSLKSKKYNNKEQKSNGYEIKFVKSKELEVTSDESEVEHSDLEDVLGNSDDERIQITVKSQCQRSNDTSFSKCVPKKDSVVFRNRNRWYRRFVSNCSRDRKPGLLTQQRTQIGEQTIIKDDVHPVTDGVQVSSCNSDLDQILRKHNILNSTATDKSLKQHVSASEILIKHNADEIDKFFSDLAILAKFLPPDVLKKLKEDIKTDVAKALKSNKVLFIN